jgi:hypothetical protein
MDASKGWPEPSTGSIVMHVQSSGSSLIDPLSSMRCGKADVLSAASFSALSSDIQKIIGKIVETNAKSFTAVVQAIRDSETRIVTQTVQSEQSLQLSLKNLRIEDSRRQRQQRLLNSLAFDNMNQRQNTVQQRVGNYGNSFKWIFEPQQKHGFSEWLVSGYGIYWINGKPGSGKSSLVDFICQGIEANNDGHALLKQWASPAPLMVLSFFFYNPAPDHLQKGFEGLWRSLCFQMLRDDPQLLDGIINDMDAPGQMKRHMNATLDSNVQWMTRDLELTFYYLVEKTRHKVFILVDGLDEFAESHARLLETIRKLANLPQLKICCSSRPDEPFNSGLANVPGLKLQDLTHDDIFSFVRQRLETTRAANLISEVVRHSEGVFLWTSLVVEEICRSISDGFSLDDLDPLIYDVSASSLVHRGRLLVFFTSLLLTFTKMDRLLAT